jgi:toxin ParE1/3/4
MEIRWLPLADEDFFRCFDFLYKISPSAAKKFRSEIKSLIELICNNPKLGKKIPELNREDVRIIIHKNYRIVYQISEPYIAIHAIEHTSQLPRFYNRLN